MLQILGVLCMLWTLSVSTELQDMLHNADRIFENLDTAGASQNAVFYKRFLERSFDLTKSSKMSKRSLHEMTSLTRDKQVSYLVKGVNDVTTIPTKFPNDISLSTYHGNTLYFVSLEAKGPLPEYRFANNLVLYQYTESGHVRETARVAVEGGRRLAVHSIMGVTYIAVAEYDAGRGHQPLEGSSLYKLVSSSNGRTFLEEVQILNVIKPQVVTFWDHMDEVYLAFGSGFDDDNKTSNTFIYKWLGQHFDFIQEIVSHDPRSLTSFSIGSFMFLAIANHQNEHGMTDIDAELFRFRLQDKTFESYQKIRTHGARDIKYFSLGDTDTGEKEHFLVVANSFERDLDGSRNYLTNSVVYKYVDNYFVPFQSFKLHGATQWLPLHGPNGEFLLLVASTYGISSFQYDGWRFSEVPLQFTQNVAGSNIMSMRSYIHSGYIHLVIANKNIGEHVNVFRVSFIKKNDLERRHQELEEWCEQALLNLDKNITSDSMSVLRKLPHKDSERLSIDGEISFEEVHITTLETKRFGHLNEHLVDLLNDANDKVTFLEAALEDLTEFINVGNADKVAGPVNLPFLEINCLAPESCTLNDVIVGKLNSENCQRFIDNIVNINEDVELHTTVEMEKVHITNDVTPQIFNGLPAMDLLDTSSQLLTNAEVIINGTVVIHGDFFVNGLMDGVTVDSDRILLAKEAQTFSDTLSIDGATIDNLEISGVLNGVNLDKLIASPPIEVDESYADLSVHNLSVAGLISGVNVNELTTHVVMKQGGFVSGNCSLTSLRTDEVFVDSGFLYNIKLTDLVQITEGNDYELKTDVNFEQNEVEINNLTVTSTINGLPVLDSQIGRGFVASSDVVIVENQLIAKDIVDSAKNLSLLNLVQSGIPLDETSIDGKLQLAAVVANNLSVNVINGVPVKSWILRNSTQPQHISGVKTFKDNIEIRGNSLVRQIDGVNVKDLIKDSFKTTGVQDLPGYMTFSKVVCNRIETGWGTLGTINWSDVTTQRNRVVIRGSLTSDHIQAQNMTIQGTVDDLSWQELVADIVLNRDDRVTGEKVVEHIRAKNMTLVGTVNAKSVQEFVDVKSNKAKNWVAVKDVKLDIPITVDDLDFEGSLDSVPKTDFGKTWLLANGDQTITSHMTFRNIFLQSGSELKNEIVNGLNLKALFTKSLKIDENASLHSINAADSIVTNKLHLNGTLNGRKLRNEAILSVSASEQSLLGEVEFKDDLRINGSLTINGLVSGIDLTRLCSQKNQNGGGINLIVGGSVRFSDEPKVNQVNEINLSKEMNEVWLKNQMSVLTGSPKFKNLETHGKTSVRGLLNEVDLSYFSQNYLSKSQGRVMMSNITIDNILIEEVARIRNATVEGYINGVNLEKLMKGVLLQGVDQVIEGKTRFHKLETKRLEMEGLLNEWDLKKDVLRYDVSGAVVTGEKMFHDLMVHNLTIAKGITLQGVNVHNWDKMAVKIDGHFTINGSLSLRAPTFNKTLLVTGKINSVPFDNDHLLTVNGNQVVTARKNFELDIYPNQTLKMSSLELDGLLGDTDFKALIADQAYVDQDLVFTGSKTFVRGFNGSNLTLKGLHQDINVSEVCQKVLSSPRHFREMDEEYVLLLNKTIELRRSFAQQPYYFDHFKMVQKLKKDVVAVVPLDIEGLLQLAVFSSAEMQQMVWDSYSKTFMLADKTWDMTNNVTFVSFGFTSHGFFIYIETSNSALVLYKETEQGPYPWPPNAKIATSNTSCVTFVDLGIMNKSCLFVGRKWNNSEILCSASVTDELMTYQILDSLGSIQVSSMNIDGDVFIAAINKEQVKNKIENMLSIYQFNAEYNQFEMYRSLPELNPVALSTISYGGEHYIVCASGHIPESVRSSSLTIFKFKKRPRGFTRYQTLRIDSPVDVHFSVLPSSQLALYVLSSNPTKAFVMFLYKGSEGFVEETSGLSLSPGLSMHSITDAYDQHFVVISGNNEGKILKAGFKGQRWRG